MQMTEIIARKRDGFELNQREIDFVVQSYAQGRIPAEQASAWLMAIVWRGMSDQETFDLTESMLRSGEQLDLSSLPPPHLDKHSTGGVGDKTSLVVVPLLAAAGISIVKMSGRGLGFSGGTLDKLESIPGYQTQRTVDQMLDQVRRIGACIVGQTETLVPADKKLYALRDVTGTVPSLPLIASSIMSKKLAGGAQNLLLDVKVGSGAFMKTLDEAQALADALAAIGVKAGRRVGVALTEMDEPLGRAIGNALEVKEAIEVLTPGFAPSRFSELCRQLGLAGMQLCDLTASEEEAQEKLERVWQSGDALQKLRQIIEAQGGDGSIIDSPNKLATAPIQVNLVSDEDGFVSNVDAETLGVASVRLGAGRAVKESNIDPSVGFEIHARRGDRVYSGSRLATIHASSEQHAFEAMESLERAFEWSSTPVEAKPIVYRYQTHLP